MEGVGAVAGSHGAAGCSGEGHFQWGMPQEGLKAMGGGQRGAASENGAETMGSGRGGWGTEEGGG